MRPDINAIEERRKRLYKSDADNVYVEDYLADTEFLLNRINDLTTKLAESKADYEAAVEDMALIVGDSNGALKCNACVYNPNDMGCELDGSQFDDDGECHWTYRGRQGNG